MAICILVRHGRTASNATGVLAGWTEGVGLDDTGRAQAKQLGERLRGSGVVTVVSSPLQRCQETADGLLHGIPEQARPPVHEESRLAEARYGAWTGRPLKELAQDDLWKDVQERPSTVTFPADPAGSYEHESMAQMQARAVEAVQEWDARVEAEHGPGAIWVAVSHGDVVKAVLADALGMSLDHFQRLVVDPASVSIVHRSAGRPFLLRSNDVSADRVDLSALTDRIRSEGATGQADVGGGAGSARGRS